MYTSAQCHGAKDMKQDAGDKIQVLARKGSTFGLAYDRELKGHCTTNSAIKQNDEMIKWRAQWVGGLLG